MTKAAPPRMRRTLLYSLTLAAALTTTSAGCADPHPGETPRPAPSPRTTSPQDLCTRIVSRWGHQLLAGGDSGYGDYQSMGLSDAQYEILRDTLDAARAERKRHNGTAGAAKLINRQARERCAEHYRDGVPGDGPWQ
ncbi:hypothetical protein ACFU5O_26310 [Streptomyces sp. NPDC057445]|uniref:hypothetical protein n=1 Tax=Streptomyces sp. NPDC057445 TaxID=3346136 RepID=UPI00369A2EDF